MTSPRIRLLTKRPPRIGRTPPERSQRPAAHRTFLKRVSGPSRQHAGEEQRLYHPEKNGESYQSGSLQAPSLQGAKTQRHHQPESQPNLKSHPRAIKCACRKWDTRSAPVPLSIHLTDRNRGGLGYAPSSPLRPQPNPPPPQNQKSLVERIQKRPQTGTRTVKSQRARHASGTEPVPENTY